jgi:hypothetical protein
MLVTSAFVTASGSVRAGTALAELAVRRTPTLVALGTWATAGTGAGADRAQAAFRDELLTLCDDAAEVAWHQLRRARDELGVRTGPPAIPATAAALDGSVRRHHRVKA